MTKQHLIIENNSVRTIVHSEEKLETAQSVFEGLHNVFKLNENALIATNIFNNGDVEVRVYTNIHSNHELTLTLIKYGD